MMDRDQVSIILERAEKEEKTYNWALVASLYEDALELLLKDNNVERKAQVNKKLGYSYARAANQVETSEQYKRLINLAICAQNIAAEYYKLLGMNGLELECLGKAHYNMGLIAESKKEAREEFDRAFEYFKEASEIYADDRDKFSLATVLSQAAQASWNLVTNCNDHKELLHFKKRGIEIAEKAMYNSLEINNLEAITTSIFYFGFIKHALEFWIGPFSLSDHESRD